MTATKVIEQTSDKTVLANRVGYFDSEFAPVGFFGPLIGGGVVSLITAGIADMFFVTTEAAFGLSGPVGVASAPLIAALYYSNVVSEKLEKYTGVKYSKLDIIKRSLNALLPAGQKMKLGKETLAINETTAPNRLVGGHKSVYADYYGRFSRQNPTHEVETELVFKPLGSYIKQTLVLSPAKVWDGAFESTVEVHKFKKPKAVKQRRSYEDTYDHSF